MDVHSYLPYEGKVVLKNKQARTALVRIPSWVAMHEVRLLVNQQAVKPVATGRYLVFQDLQPKAEIVLAFPIVERTGKYFIHNKEFTATFRGSTVIEIDPPLRWTMNEISIIGLSTNGDTPRKILPPAEHRPKRPSSSCPRVYCHYSDPFAVVENHRFGDRCI